MVYFDLSSVEHELLNPTYALHDCLQKGFKVPSLRIIRPHQMLALYFGSTGARNIEAHMNYRLGVQCGGKRLSISAGFLSLPYAFAHEDRDYV